jgi:hypothetical protein
MELAIFIGASVGMLATAILILRHILKNFKIDGPR